MSIEAGWRAAVRAALAEDPLWAATINRIGDGESEGAPVPSAWIGDVIGSDWGAKDRPGREMRLGLTIVDRGEGERIAALLAAAEGALLAMPRALTVGDGAMWDSSGPVVTRVRFARRRDGTRVAMIDLRLRAWGGVTPASPLPSPT
jgi:hypothetical protein